MKNIEQVIIPCIATLCIGLMIGIFIGKYNASSSTRLSVYDRISEDMPTQTTPYRLENTGKININTASANELMMIPGIGETRAGNIIAHRLQYGPFLEIKDITNVKGISVDCFRKIQEYITVGG